MENLPTSWEVTPIENILAPRYESKTIQQGWSPRCEKLPSDSNESWGVLKTTAIQAGYFIEDENKKLPEHLAPKEKIEVIEGDILLTCAGPRNRCGVPTLVRKTRPRLMMSGKMYRFQPMDKYIHPNYLEFYLLSHEAQFSIDKMKTGSSDSGLNLTHGRFKELLVPVAPFYEQTRIVDKIDELFSELDKGIESLKTAKTQLAVYRQALLKHAFEGKLTEQWRSDNADSLESPEKLLARVQQEREDRFQQQLDDWEIKVEQWKADGKDGKKPTKPRIPKSIVSIDDIDMANVPSLPGEWTWVTLDMLISGLPRAMQSGPFGSNLKHSEFQEDGVLVLGIDNVKSGDFSLGSQNRISEGKYKELQKYTARPGDLLVTVMASLGRSCVVPRDLEKAIITKHVYRISMEQKLLLPEFYNLILQSHTISRTRMFENAQGQTRPGLNSTILRELPMPLCSLEEQQQIFKILEEKLSIVTKFEEEIDSNIERSSLLRLSILKRAFSGQLVAQDPKDEPASELLKKIAIEKAELVAKEKADKATARKAKVAAKKAKV